VVIKTQAWEPDTCAAGERPCRILILWDTDQAPELREHRVAAFERTCSAHADDLPEGVMLWWDGNYKPLTEYIAYQRAFFLRRNHTEWQARFPNGEQPMPETIASYTSDPVTTGSVAAPEAAKLTGLARAYSRNNQHNARKNQAIGIPGSVRAGIDLTRITWTYSGVGDARVLTVNCGGQLTTQQRNQAQNLADTAFGPGKVVVVA